METSLASLLVLTLIIDKGLCLECEECIGIDTCFGNMYTCAPEKDRCGVTYLRTPFGLSQIIKTCVPSMVCDKGVQVLNLGWIGMMVGQLTCCEGDECGKVAPPSVSKQTNPNGKQCPVCFSMQNSCFEVMSICNGDQLYCAEGFLHSEGLGFEFSMKGCANQLFCNDLLGYETVLTGHGLNHSIRCTPAATAMHLQDVSTVSQLDFLVSPQGDSGAMRIVPRWFGLIILAVSGALLTKLLV